MDLTVPKEQLWRRLSGSGIEIGAFHSPMPVPEGTQVRYVDLISAEDTHRFYPELSGLAMDIVDPDLLSPADDLSEIESGSQDFVIASHLLEHLANPVAGLREWNRILIDGGYILLVLPDKRATFDQHRQHTSLVHLLEDDELGASSLERVRRDREHFVEWGHWVNGLEDPEQLAFWARMLESVSYPIHFHCFVPTDIDPLLDAFRRRGGPNFTVEDRVVREGAMEFALLLRKDIPPPPADEEP